MFKQINRQWFENIINKLSILGSDESFSSREAEYLTGIDKISKAPLPRVVWITPLVIFSLFVVGVLWASLSTIDVVSQATGVVVPAGKVKYVQAPGQYVVKRLLVKDGQLVTKGQPLIEFDFTSQKAQKDKYAAELVSLRLQEARLAALVAISREEQSGKAVNNPEACYVTPDSIPQEYLLDEKLLYLNMVNAHRMQQVGFDNEISKLEVSTKKTEASARHAEAVYQIAKSAHERMRNLYEKELVSQEQIDAVRQNEILARSDMELKRLEQETAKADLSLKKLERDNYHQKFLQENLNQLITVRQDIKTIEHELVSLNKELEYEVITAPDEGMVLNTVVHTVGGVVSAAQVLMEIVPGGGELELEAMILNRDIGFVETGDSVRVKIDTFTFTRYGYIDGVIREVAKNAIADENLGRVFKVWVTLNSQSMKINGKQVPLSAGETATVDVMTDKRQIIDFILSRILEYKDEAMRDR